MDPQAMARLHPPGSVGKIDLILLDRTRLQEDFLVEPVAESRAPAAIAHQHRATVGKDINELGHKVGVLSSACGIQAQDDRSDDVHGFVKGLRAVAENVLTRLQMLLVERTRNRL